jgi:hypothetical protein
VLAVTVGDEIDVARLVRHRDFAYCVNETLMRPAASVILQGQVTIPRGIPGHIRSDNGPEFVAEAVQKWIAAVGAKTAYIECGARGRTATSRGLSVP